MLPSESIDRLKVFMQDEQPCVCKPTQVNPIVSTPKRGSLLGSFMMAGTKGW